MSQLFIELYLDENVSVLVADLIKARGFIATTARDAGQLGKSDEGQLAYAISKQQAFLTHNRVHFERLAREYSDAGKQHHGIIIATRRSSYELVRRLLPIIDRVTADEMRNQLRYI